jgi:hypothetical protein
MDTVPEQTSFLSSTQRGSIAEAIVAAQLMLVSNGRLSPFKPIADDDGTDLLLMDKADGRVLVVQVKARFADQERPPPTVQFDTRIATFKEAAPNYLLAILIDPLNGALWRAWLIPSGDLRAISASKGGKLVITPNPALHSQDRYSDWRCENIKAAVLRLTK